MNIKSLILSLSCLLLSISVYAQVDEVVEQDSTNILVKNADNFIRDATSLPAVQYLKGNVRMFQDSIFMFCDSARLQSNNLTALGNVIIIHQDSIKVFADSLIYNGDLREAELYSNVVLENGEQRLFSNELFYDLNLELATYKDTALLSNKRAQVKSIQGYYDVKKKEAKFIEDVVIVDSVFTMQTDSLLYNTEIDLATFISHTIIDKEDQHIECNSGYYDIGNDRALFGNNATFRDSSSTASAKDIFYEGKDSNIILDGDAVYFTETEYASADKMTINEERNDILLEGSAYYTSDKQSVRGEKIIYNRDTEDIQVDGEGKIESESMNIEATKLNFESETNTGEATGNVVWIDTVDNYRIDSEKIIYNDSINYIKAQKIEGERPLLRNILDNDTIFISSDTLEFLSTEMEQDTINEFDAKNNVKILFGEMSAICGKMNYNDVDSIFVLMEDPIMWKDSTQFFADTIFIHMVDDAIERMVLKNNGMMISWLQAEYYNQIVGKTFIAYFDSSEIKTMDVAGNSRALYFLQDDDKAFIGVNKTDCSSMKFYFQDSELDRISFYQEPNSTLTPMKQVKNDVLFLDGFSWNLQIKPVSVEDLLSEAILRKSGSKRASAPGPIPGADPSEKEGIKDQKRGSKDAPSREKPKTKLDDPSKKISGDG